MPLFDKKISDNMSKKLIEMTLRKKFDYEIKERYMVGNTNYE